MKGKLTDPELAYIRKHGATMGAAKLLTLRCIELPIQNRPFHCVDESRNKYLVRQNGKWVVDRKAKIILAAAFELLAEAYPLVSKPKKNGKSSDSDSDSDLDVDSENLEERIKQLEQMTQVRNKSEIKKIVDELNRLSNIKNNLKNTL